MPTLVNLSILDPATVQPITGLVLLSDATTVITGADGIRRSSIKVTWAAPADQFVIAGGQVFIQHRVHPSGGWIDDGSVDGAANQFNITNVSDGTAYDVRIRARSVHGSLSGWTEADNCVVVGVASNPSYRPTSNPLTATDAGASATINIAGFTMRVGGVDKSIGSGSVTSLAYKTLYYVYYSDPSISGGSVSFSASVTKETAILGSGKFLVGSIITPASGGTQTVGNNDGGAVGSQNGDGFTLSPTLWSPDGTNWYPTGQGGGGFPATFSRAASDGDNSTFGSASVLGPPTIQIYFGGFPSMATQWGTLNLKLKTAAFTDIAGTGVAADYSVNSLASFTNIYTLGSGVNTLGSPRLDTTAIPITTPAGALVVRFTLNGITSGTSRVDLYEIWLEGRK
jgi:hypothetical protein